MDPAEEVGEPGPKQEDPARQVTAPAIGVPLRAVTPEAAKAAVNAKSRRPRNPQPPAFRILGQSLAGGFYLRGGHGAAGIQVTQLAFDVGLQA